MKNLIASILCALWLLSPANSWAGKSYRVAVFADGVMGGYQLQEQDTFAAKLKKKIQAAGYDQIEVFNVSTFGTTTASATDDVDQVTALRPDVVIVQLGFNDAKRGVVTSAIGSSLNSIIARVKETGAYIILAGIRAPAGTEENYARAIEETYHNAAESNSVPLYPNVMEGIAEHPSLTLADGMHPNTVGVEYMVEALFPLVDVGLRWRYEVFQQEMQNNKQGQGVVAP